VTDHFSPHISKEHDFFVIWKYQKERSLDATQAVILVAIPVTPGSSSRYGGKYVRASFLVVFDRDGLLSPIEAVGFFVMSLKATRFAPITRNC
jgi:hypothetical protein